MILQFSAYAIAYVLIALIAALLGWYTWKRRAMPGGTYFSLLMFAVSFWALMCVVEQTVTDSFVNGLSTLMEYVVVTWAGPLWLLFVLDYGYRDRWPVTRKTLWIWAVPLAITALALTNPWHGLIWYRGPRDLIVFGHAVGLWVNLLYTYGLLFPGFVLLIWAAIRSYKKNYLGATALLLGAMIPVVTSILYMAGFSYGGVTDVTPIALAATILLYTWGVFGQRLFDIVPVAREALVRSMVDGILVLDKEGRIADLNPAAMHMFGATEAVIGRPADVVLSKWPALLESCHGESEGPSEITIEGEEGPMWIDVRISALQDCPGKFQGRLVALQDITKRKLAEEELKRSNVSLQDEVIERKQVEAELVRSNGALQSEITERRHAEERLEASLHEKEMLLKEIHHRVKNNLQIISSLLSLQIVSTANEGASIGLKESQNRIRSMALIHEKLYQSSDLAVIDFREYVRSLVVSLTRSYVLNHALEIDVDIEDVSLDIDTAIPCGLIINELISNCLKYAFPGGEAGKIRVSLKRSGGLYRLTVSDNGVGLPPGVDFRNTASLGLQLVMTLAGQLNGTIERPEGKGTTFVISFGDNPDDAEKLAPGKSR